MRITFVINNYTLGAKLRSAPTHKLVQEERIDRNHTIVTFEDVTANEVSFMEKLFAKKGKIEEV